MAAVFAAALWMFSLGGCALSALTAENVMEPPEAYGDGAELQTALEDALGPQITLRYPRSGEYRSAVVRADLDKDEHDEAIVFYRPATESSGARMVLMDTNDEDEWTMAGEFADAEGEIDRVIFGDIDGDGVLDIITGWSAYSDYGTIFIHSCAGGSLRRISISDADGVVGAKALSSYAELAVGDFDGDKVDELLTVTLAGADETGQARLLKWQSTARNAKTGVVYQIGSLELAPGAAAYTGSIAGQIAQNMYGIVIDSQRTGGSYASELVLWNGETGELVSPVDEEGRGLFTRTLSTVAADIDGDGCIEIPGDSLLPGCASPSAQKVYLTDWYRFDSEKYICAFSAIMRPDSGYYITVPEHWRGVVTAQPDQATRTLCFYLADERKPFSTELMRIRVFTLDEWDEEDTVDWLDRDTEYEELCTTDYYVYAVQITDNNAGLRIDFNAVQRYFTLLV